MDVSFLTVTSSICDFERGEFVAPLGALMSFGESRALLGRDGGCDSFKEGDAVDDDSLLMVDTCRLSSEGVESDFVESRRSELNEEEEALESMLSTEDVLGVWLDCEEDWEDCCCCFARFSAMAALGSLTGSIFFSSEVQRVAKSLISSLVSSSCNFFNFF